MTEPSTPLDLDAIRRLWSNYVLNGLGPEGGYAAHLVAERVPALLAEVERLRAELDKADRHFEEFNDQSIWAHREVERLCAKISAALALHRPVHEDAHGVFGCSGCDIGESWPCPTVRALGGEVPDA